MHAGYGQYDDDSQPITDFDLIQSSFQYSEYTKRFTWHTAGTTDDWSDMHQSLYYLAYTYLNTGHSESPALTSSMG